MSTIIKSTEFKPEMITYSEPKQLSGGREKLFIFHTVIMDVFTNSSYENSIWSIN